MKPACDPWEPEIREIECERCKRLCEPWYATHCVECGREVCVDCAIDLVRKEDNSGGNCVCADCAEINIDELNEALGLVSPPLQREVCDAVAR